MVEEKKNKDIFISPTSGTLPYQQMIKEITLFVKSQPDYNYKVIVGSDSQPKNGTLCDFVTAVVVHRIGHGGKYFWRRHTTNRKWVLQDRIGEEINLSLELAWKLRDTFRTNGLSGFEPEVHVDVGEEGKTREMIKWVTGMVIGSGLAVKIKPESFGASKVADRHT